MSSSSLSGPPKHHREWKIGCKVYIGNLAEGASKADIEDAFSKYGPLKNVWVARAPPGFAFVEYEDSRDAEDACRQLDGTRIAGGRIKAEMSHGRTRRGRGPPSFARGVPPYPVNALYNGPGGRIPYSGGHRGGDYHSGSGGGGHHHHHHHHHHRGPPPSLSHSGHHDNYIERGRDKYAPQRPLRSPEFRTQYSRSRSKSPPMHLSPRATARPRTPPSRTPSTERHFP